MRQASSAETRGGRPIAINHCYGGKNRRITLFVPLSVLTVGGNKYHRLYNCRYGSTSAFRRPSKGCRDGPDRPSERSWEP